jgi:hypothetical protein
MQDLSRNEYDDEDYNNDDDSCGNDANICDGNDEKNVDDNKMNHSLITNSTNKTKDKNLVVVLYSNNLDFKNKGKILTGVGSRNINKRLFTMS